ncbi:MAG: PspC domain-containing protein [Caldisericia bacterium]|nr:PspC domain-containing protein [Caldisericia bacterium]
MKKLYRSRDKTFTGLLGGIAEYFKIDPFIPRIVFIVLLFSPKGSFGFVGFFSLAIGYFVFSSIIPERSFSDKKNTNNQREGLRDGEISGSAKEVFDEN